jgi:hypothetical protein
MIVIPVKRFDQKNSPIVHVATQALHNSLGCIYIIACEGEDTALAWIAQPEGTVPTCLACLAEALP